MFFGKNQNETSKRAVRSSFDAARRLDLDSYIRRMYIDPATAQNSAPDFGQGTVPASLEGSATAVQNCMSATAQNSAPDFKPEKRCGSANIAGPKKKKSFFANALFDKRAEKNDGSFANDAVSCESEESPESVYEFGESYASTPDAAASPESVYEAEVSYERKYGSGFREEPFADYHEGKLAERIKHLSDTYSEYLLYLIREHGMDNAEVWKNAIVDKKVFSKIKNNRTYHPNKLTALCLCVGAHLNLDETKDLLARAGYALSPCDKTDIIFAYFIENQIYDMIELDIQLEEHGQPCIIA